MMMTEILIWLFYNHLILSGTKIAEELLKLNCEFYNHLILSGTKIIIEYVRQLNLFYNHLILSGTKIHYHDTF